MLPENIYIKDTLYLNEIIETLLKSGYWVRVEYNENETAQIFLKEK